MDAVILTNSLVSGGSTLPGIHILAFTSRHSLRGIRFFVIVNNIDTNVVIVIMPYLLSPFFASPLSKYQLLSPYSAFSSQTFSIRNTHKVPGSIPALANSAYE